MKYIFYLGLVLFAFSCTSSKVEESNLMDDLSAQLNYLVENTKDPVKVPRSWNESDGYKMIGKRDWCSGFNAGSYWYMYELTGDVKWKDIAINNTEKLEGLQYVTTTHDLGFMVFCSYGNAYRIVKNEAYKDFIIKASESLISRFNPTVGCIKSWDHGSWQFPVIIDNMMNLEMLFWASEVSGDNRFKEVAITHANTTLKYHFREDMSSFHVLDYDTITGDVLKKQTHQGYSDESAWARGQSWGLYGYTMMYRFTKDAKYLDAAEKIAEFIIPNLPKDKVPYWDYNAPDIPNTERDASAGALIASAFYELGTYVENGEKYFNIADEIIGSLSSEKYLATYGTNGGFLLKHSVGHKPGNSEIDVPLNYADYYYLEAVKRQKEHKNL